MDKEEILTEIRMLEKIIEFHATHPAINDPKEFEKHINDILDRISELKKMLE